MGQADFRGGTSGAVSIYVFIMTIVVGAVVTGVTGGAPETIGYAAGAGAVIGLIRKRSVATLIVYAIAGALGGGLFYSGLPTDVYRWIRNTVKLPEL